MPFARFFTSLNVFIIILFVGSLALSPILVDKKHMEDTILLMDIAWRGFNGLHSVIDFPSPYGGAIEKSIALISSIFGFTFKSIDYSFIFMFFMSSMALICASIGRISIFNTIITITLSASIILSGSLLSDPPDIMVAHSVSYNHVGISLILAAAIFALSNQENTFIEIFSAIIIGLFLYIATLFKATLLIIYFAVVASCALQRRWISIAGLTAGVLIGMLSFDFGGVRLIGSLKLFLSSPAAHTHGLSDRLLAFFYMLRNAFIPISIIAAAFLYLLQARYVNIRYVIAAVFMFGAYAACTITMYGSGLLLLPILIVIMISLSGKMENRLFLGTTETVALIFAYSIILPACIISIYAFFLSTSNRGAVLISDGPASTYFVYGTSTKGLSSIRNINDRLDLALKNTVRKLTNRAKLDDSDESILDDSDKYVFLADGIQLLNKVENIKIYGIAANGRAFNFPSALGSKVVNSLQIWPIRGLPMMRDRSRLGSDVDIVMMAENVGDWGLFSADLNAMMKDEFTFCVSSTLWRMFVRKELHDKICPL